jgi:hypothetical protein
MYTVAMQLISSCDCYTVIAMSERTKVRLQQVYTSHIQNPGTDHPNIVFVLQCSNTFPL